MNRNVRNTLLIAAALVAGNAMAQEAGDRGLNLSDAFGRPVVSQTSQHSRAQVAAEAARAVAADEIASSGDVSVAEAVDTNSAKSRQQVRAETAQAVSVGQVNSGYNGKTLAQVTPGNFSAL
jgi:hypothetical protein